MCVASLLFEKWTLMWKETSSPLTLTAGGSGRSGATTPFEDKSLKKAMVDNRISFSLINGAQQSMRGAWDIQVSGRNRRENGFRPNEAVTADCCADIWAVGRCVHRVHVLRQSVVPEVDRLVAQVRGGGVGGKGSTEGTVRHGTATCEDPVPSQ